MLLLLASLPAIASVAGCAEESSIQVISSPETFDPVIRRALAENSVVPIRRPAPESAPLVELGELLFHDPILSGDKDIACASCHEGPAGLGDGLPLAVGTGARGKFPTRTKANGLLIARNGPPLFNVGLAAQRTMLHDGRVERDPSTGILKTNIAALNIPVPTPPSTTAEKVAAQLTSALAMQAMTPVLSREEMRGVSSTADDNELGDVPDDDPFESWRRIMVRLTGDPGTGPVNATQTAYLALFQAAYPGTAHADLNFGHAARAIAAYEREDFSALASPFDRYVAGDDSALTDEQKRGALIFFGKTKKGKCANCHSGPLLSDLQHHALAVPQIGPGKASLRSDQTPDRPGEDRGRALVTDDAADDYKFRTPSLRNVARSGPYFHAGSHPTLRAVMIFYNDIEAGARDYETTFFPQIDPSLGITLDTVSITARIEASKLDPLLPQKLGLTDREIDDLVAFMNALTDDVEVDEPPASVPSGLPVGGL